MSTYGYVEGDPLGSIDPLGLRRSSGAGDILKGVLTRLGGPKAIQQTAGLLARQAARKKEQLQKQIAAIKARFTRGLRAKGVAEAPGCENVANSGRLVQTGGGNLAQSADELYEAIRASGTDVQSIAASTGFKPANIQKVKDHVFYNEHLLDRYAAPPFNMEPTIGRFDSNLAQAQAWQRLETGTHTDLDIMWLRHETAERWYELRYNSGYSEAHNRVEPRWPGNPWGG